MNKREMKVSYLDLLKLQLEALGHDDVQVADEVELIQSLADYKSGDIQQIGLTMVKAHAAGTVDMTHINTLLTNDIPVTRWIHRFGKGPGQPTNTVEWVERIRTGGVDANFLTEALQLGLAADTPRKRGDERSQNDVIRRFESRASNGEQILAYGKLREEFTKIGLIVDSIVPAGREKALAMTKLEEALMWANKGVNQSEDW